MDGENHSEGFASVDNSQVWSALSDMCEVTSEIQYGTLWHEGKPTSIRNGDHFFYITEAAVSSLPENLVSGFPAHLFKPKAMAMCKRCKQVGHYAGDNKCPAKVLPEIADTVEPFHGGVNPLSNLHACPEGCIVLDGHHDFLTAEHHYQFNRLQFHGMHDESYQVLKSDTGFEAIKLAQEVLPDQETQPEWKSIAVEEMLKTNKLKYDHCPHARTVLTTMKGVLAEATSNTFWGTGLIPDHIRHTLSDYWPGQNQMGKILVQIHQEITVSEPVFEKHKATSPLSCIAKSQHT